jgi:hypothetical protein
MDELIKESVEPTHIKKEKNILRSKPWVVSTFVLGILVLILLLGNVFHLTGGVISSAKMGDLALNFANNNLLSTAGTLESVKSVNGLYQVNIEVSGDMIPLYFTKDGSWIGQGSGLVSIVSEEEEEETIVTEIPKSDKPIVELFVMSYCPYGTQAEKGILPVVELLGDKIDFNLRFVYYVMHPTQGEVEENLREYCIQKEQESKLNTYLSCFLEAGDSSSCLTKAGVDKTKLNACVSKADKEFQVSENKADKTKWLSGNYPLFNVDKTLNDLYNIAGSPTLIINGVQANSARDPSSYLDVVCQAFSDGNVPEECGEQLSTTVYSAGFGYETSGSTTAAQCA